MASTQEERHALFASFLPACQIFATDYAKGASSGVHNACMSGCRGWWEWGFLRRQVLGVCVTLVARHVARRCYETKRQRLRQQQQQRRRHRQLSAGCQVPAAQSEVGGRLNGWPGGKVVGDGAARAIITRYASSSWRKNQSVPSFDTALWQKKKGKSRAPTGNAKMPKGTSVLFALSSQFLFHYLNALLDQP